MKTLAVILIAAVSSLAAPAQTGGNTSGTGSGSETTSGKRMNKTDKNKADKKKTVEKKRKAA